MITEAWHQKVVFWSILSDACKMDSSLASITKDLFYVACGYGKDWIGIVCIGLDWDRSSLKANVTPPSGSILEADFVHLLEAVRRHQVHCWRPEPVMLNVKRHREGQ